jgi:hypothetical protein
MTVSAGGTNQFDLLTDFAFVSGMTSMVGATVSRIRMTCAFQRTSTAASLDALAIGIGVFPRGIDAVDLGPLTINAHADWMFWTKRFISEESTGTPATAAGPFWEFDVKAMRRMDEIGMQLLLVIEAQALLAGTFGFGVSSLLLLP